MANTEAVWKTMSGLTPIIDRITQEPVLTAVAVVFLTTVLLLIILYLGTRTTKGTTILLLGLCDSGKTLLYSMLTEGRSVMTNTSIKENKGRYKIKSDKHGKSLDLVDLPGHERIRTQYLNKYKDMARCVIFVVDSANFPREIRDVAEYMYDVIADKTFNKLKLPILVACNKQDLPTSKSCSVIESQLEKELNNLRVTRAAALLGTDDSSATMNAYIGKKGKDFEFSHVTAMKVEFVETNLKGDEGVNMKEIEKWIERLV